MKKNRLTALLLALSLWAPALPLPAQPPAPSAAIRVNLKEEKAPVSPGLSGIFMEEISHAFDGGIYAELIQNRSFEEGVLPPGMKLVKKPDGNLKMELVRLPAGVPEDKWDMPWPWNGNCNWDPGRALVAWSLKPEGGAKGEMEPTSAHPMNEASTRSLALSVTPGDAPGSRVDLVNSGYWGISVQQGVSYDLTFHLRPETYEGPVSASLETGDGKVLARHDFGTVRPAAAWKKYSATLQADGTDPRARFVLSFAGKGGLQVDWVSLFPPTYKKRPNGLRPELAKYLEELKPDFIRYPGGCYVQGLSWESAPDWRKMVCPPEDRPGQWGYWKYRSTDGFGYHEFLQFCEDIDADAMFVSFAGMTVHPENNWPIEDLDSVIQRTLDSIEYAIGPTESKWGKVRARMGHPEPFRLKYVEIGNEHPPAIYGDYYVKFRQAIKAKYPQITVIMSMYWSGLNRGAIARAGDENIDIVDEHAYKASGWVRTNFDYFDKYKRTPWKVYVGEYAHHSQNGDWSAAMDDSLYIMMMERNGDLVTMASYAPLFVNVNQSSWGVNLIEFDSSRSFAHAAYYVQKTFNETRPDVNLASVVEELPKPDPERPLLAGRIGLGAWSSQAEFKELRVYDEQDKLVYSDDFKSLENWETPGTGKWQAADGVLRQTDARQAPAVLLLKNFQLGKGKVTLKARRTDGRDGVLLLFNAASPNDYLFCNYGGNRNEFCAIQSRGSLAGASFQGGRNARGGLENDRWYDLALTVGRDRAEMALDGRRQSSGRVDSLPAFFANAGYDREDKMVVVRATNYHAAPLRADIELEGAGEVGRTGRHIVLRSDNPKSDNSLEKPLSIVPQESPLKDCAKKFSVVLPPLSVNVLCIPARATP